MALIVQKYGGSSVADADKIRNVARRIIRTKEQGNCVVVVVSAMGKTTDQLIALAKQVSPHPDDREMDLLLSTGELVSCTLMAMALREMGHKAISLSGGQAGIWTDSMYSRARILKVDPQRIHKELDGGNIVIVAGFQGINEDMDITTLGRGGSDTTAVALAIGLEADECQIYTDVEGVYTADPRMVPEASKLPEIGYEEMLELATYGAKVMHSRAVELGEIYGMPILVASSFNEAPGTLIHGGVNDMEVRNKVRGIAQDTNVAKITVVGIPNHPGTAASLFEPLAKAGVSIDTIVQNISAHVDRTDITFTVSRSDLHKAITTLKETQPADAKDYLSDASLAKVSIVGTGMETAPGYAARMFRALSDAGINIELITTSEIRITCIIAEEAVPGAVKALHRAFELEKP